MGTREHKESAPKAVTIGIISVSTSRALANDESGHWIHRQALAEGHEVLFHQVIPDDSTTISQTVGEVIQKFKPQVLLLSGGTGISSRDVTIEAVRPLFSKELTAFSPLFAQLSFRQISSAAILSRATAGVVGNTVLFCMPGSFKACKLACTELIFPELGHLVRHILIG
ncbi:MAG: molybdenum cofactor biosynthesis protein MoaB [Deltaproteobacteria bacterium]|nr:MAG: molybdenum cofactor biosynthesis protein MoaB [Deltaproteobacteria bacterium]